MSSAGISFGGLASGLDTRAIITALVSIERRPIRQLELKKTLYTRQKSLYGDLEELLDKLETAVKALKTRSLFLSMKATSDNDDVVTALATSSATPGTHIIEVFGLATAQVNTTDGRASATETLGTYGEFTLTVDGVDHVISLTDPTPQSISDAINALGVDVSAEVIDTGNASIPFRLVIRSTETGASNNFSISAITGDPLAVTFLTELNSNQANGLDAHVQVNGIDIYRASNSISGVVTGVTFDLKSINSPSTATVTIATDSEEVSSNVQKFVDAYNAVVDFHAAQNVVSDEGEARSDLFGDSTLRSMRTNLRSIIGNAVTTTGNVAYQMLSQIGIVSDINGKLTFTASKFEEALADDEQAVAAIFADSTNGISKRLQAQIKVYTDSVDGLIKTRQDGFDRLVKQTNRRIEDGERRLEQFQKRLEIKYANLEGLLSRLQSQGSTLSSIFRF